VNKGKEKEEKTEKRPNGGAASDDQVLDPLEDVKVSLETTTLRGKRQCACVPACLCACLSRKQVNDVDWV